MNYPNGLEIVDQTLYVSTWGVVTDPETFGTEVPGRLLAVDMETKAVEPVSGSVGNLDGLVSYGASFLASDWIAGGLISIDASGAASTVLELEPGTADFYFASGEGLLLVPQMLENKLVAYRMSH